MKLLLFIIFLMLLSFNVNSQNLKNEVISVESVNLIPSKTQSTDTQAIAIPRTHNNNIANKNNSQQLLRIEKSKNLSANPSKVEIVLNASKTNDIYKQINVLQTDPIVLKKKILSTKTIPKISLSNEE